MAQPASLGNLYVTLTANTLQYTRAMKNAARSTEVQMATMSRAVKLGTAAMAASFAVVTVASVKAFAEFESSFTGVKKTVDGTKEEIDALAVSFRNMAREIPVNVNEINKVGEAAGQLGIAIKDIEAFTDTMLRLGVTTNLTAEDAAVGFARLANITGMAASDFERLGSVVVELGNNMATTEQEILTMALRLAGAGSMIRLTEGEIFALSATLSSIGLRAELGGTAFTRVMLEMNKAVDEAEENLQMFAAVAGMSVEQFTRTFEEDASEALISFVEGLKRIDEEGQNVTLTLEALGFDGIRVQQALLKASGAGDLLRKSMMLQNKAFKENNAMAKESELRFATFESKLQLTYNRLNDMAIIVGGTLVPVLEQFLDVTGRSTDQMAEFDQKVEDFGGGMASMLQFGIAVVSDFKAAWEGVFLIIEIGMARAYKEFQLLVKEVKNFGKQAKAWLGNPVAAVWDQWKEDAKSSTKAIKEARKEFDEGTDIGSLAIKELTDKLAKLSDRKSAVVDFYTGASEAARKKAEAVEKARKEQEEYQSMIFDLVPAPVLDEDEIKAGTKAVEEQEEAWKSLDRIFGLVGESSAEFREEFNPIFTNSDDVVAIYSNSMGEITTVTKSMMQSWEAAVEAGTMYIDHLGQYKPVTAEMIKDFNELKEVLASPFDEDNMKKLDNYIALLQKGDINPQQFQTGVDNLMGQQGVGAGLGMGMSGPGSDMADAFGGLKLEEQRLAQEHQEILTEIEKGGAEERMKILRDLEQRNLSARQENQDAQNELILSGMQDLSGSMLGLLETTAGKQSGIYKAMFAVDKAFAIASSMIKIQQGIANAAALPFPANLGAMAVVAANTASIIGNIQAVTANFEGGGRTPKGARAGGIDGKGGFMAILHPNEKIIDLNKDDDMASGGSDVEWTINVINNTGAEVSTTVDDENKRIEVLMEKTEKRIANNVRTGRGDMASAITDTFGVGRGRV